MFRVEWLQSALNELTDIWAQGDSGQRQAITAAGHAIDQRLASNPRNEGESREAGRRVTFVPPLAVVFQVEPDGRTVTVLRLRLFTPRRR